MKKLLLIMLMLIPFAVMADSIKNVYPPVSSGGGGGSCPNDTETLIAALDSDASTGDSVYISSYLLAKTANPDTAPSGNSNGAAMSSDGQYLAISHAGTTAPAKLITYKWDATDARYEATANANTLPNGYGSIAMSGDGQYLAVCSNASPYLVTYKWSSGNNRYEITTAADTIPGAYAHYCALSSDGEYLAVGYSISPYIVTYKWSSGNNRYEATTTPDTALDGNGYGCAMTSDGQKIVVGSNGTQKLFSFVWNGTNNRYEATSNPDTQPSGTSIGNVMSSDGAYMALLHYGSTGQLKLMAYKWSSGNNRYELTDAFEELPEGQVNRIAMSSDGQYFFASHNSANGSNPYLMCYKWNAANNRYETLASPDIAPSGNSYSIALSSDCGYVAVAHNGTDAPAKLITYKQDITEQTHTVYPISNPQALPSTASAIGYMAEDGTTGQQKSVTTMWWKNFMAGDFE